MPDLLWFNASTTMRVRPTGPPWARAFRVLNLFNRRQSFRGGGWEWGVGLVQIGLRHLVYAGSTGICVLGVWLVGGPNRCVLGRELSSGS